MISRLVVLPTSANVYVVLCKKIKSMMLCLFNPQYYFNTQAISFLSLLFTPLLLAFLLIACAGC